uniref:MHC class I-like antigen recognition-like domain-containing protein n=1 Tax=Salvator merianae TaxID=96440 RepID=A0A8D0DT56_SALMN
MVCLAPHFPFVHLSSGNRQGPQACGSYSKSLAVPERRLPQFVAKAYVDDQIIGYYDSKVREASPAVPWVKKIEMEAPGFWKWNTQRTQDSERVFRDDLRILQRRYNQTEGKWSIGFTPGSVGLAVS